MSGAPRRALLDRVRAALVVVVALFVLLEGLRYATTSWWRQQFEVLPCVGVTKDGAPWGGGMVTLPWVESRECVPTCVWAHTTLELY